MNAKAEREKQQELAAWKSRAAARRGFKDLWLELDDEYEWIPEIHCLLRLAAEIYTDRDGKTPEQYAVCPDGREVVCYEPYLLGMTGIISEHYEAEWVKLHLHWKGNEVTQVTIDIAAGGDFTNYAKHKGRYGHIPATYRFTFFKNPRTGGGLAFTMSDARRGGDLDQEARKLAKQFLAECAERIEQIENGDYFPTYAKPGRPWVPGLSDGPLR